MAMLDADHPAPLRKDSLHQPVLHKPNLPKTILSALRRNRLRDGNPVSRTPITLGRVGSLEIRLAQTEREIRKAQRLRYKVFYKEMSAKPDSHTKFTRRDADTFDAICDHLLVLDHDSPKKKFRRREPRIVGTYRLLRQDMADLFGGFYSASEFNIRPLLAAHADRRFLELGRSCVLKDYRTKRTIELLWQGIWAYVQIHKIDVMIGCASIPGTDPKELAEPLTFLAKQGKLRLNGRWKPGQRSACRSIRCRVRQSMTRRRSECCRRCSRPICGLAVTLATAPWSTHNSAPPTSSSSCPWRRSTGNISSITARPM